MKKEINNFKSKENAITLIALIITIIVLLIIVVVTIWTTLGNKNIIGKANIASQKTIEEKEKEIIGMAYVSSMSSIYDGQVSLERFQEELNHIVGENKTIVTLNQDNTFNVFFRETENNYNVNSGVITKVTGITDIDNSKIKLYTCYDFGTRNKMRNKTRAAVIKQNVPVFRRLYICGSKLQSV